MQSLGASRRPVPYLLPGLLIALGVALLTRGHHLPEYTVPNGHDLLFNKSWEEKAESSGNSGRVFDEWEALSNRVRTRRVGYIDYGFSALALGLGILVILAANKIRAMRDIREMKTPGSPLHFYIYATLVWLSFAPAQIFFPKYNSEVEQGPWVENNSVPDSTANILFGILITLPGVMFGVWLATRRRSMPVSLWSSPLSGRFGLANFAIWLSFLALVLVTIDCIVTDPPLVLSCVFTTYLLLCGQATSASPVHTREARGFEVIIKRE